MASSNRAPNRQYPAIGGGHSGHRWPQTDVEARAAGLDKCIRVSDGGAEYHHSVDRKELIASGAYTWVPWPNDPPAA